MAADTDGGRDSGDSDNSGSGGSNPKPSHGSPEFVTLSELERLTHETTTAPSQGQLTTSGAAEDRGIRPDSQHTPKIAETKSRSHKDSFGTNDSSTPPIITDRSSQSSSNNESLTRTPGPFVGQVEAPPLRPRQQQQQQRQQQQGQHHSHTFVHSQDDQVAQRRSRSRSSMSPSSPGSNNNRVHHMAWSYENQPQPPYISGRSTSRVGSEHNLSQRLMSSLMIPPPPSPDSQFRHIYDQQQSQFAHYLSTRPRQANGNGHDSNNDNGDSYYEGTPELSPRRPFTLYSPSIMSSANTSELAALGIDKYGISASDLMLTVSNSSVYAGHSRHASEVGQSLHTSPLIPGTGRLRSSSVTPSSRSQSCQSVTSQPGYVSSLAKEYESIVKARSDSIEPSRTPTPQPIDIPHMPEKHSGLRPKAPSSDSSDSIISSHESGLSSSGTSKSSKRNKGDKGHISRRTSFASASIKLGHVDKVRDYIEEISQKSSHSPSSSINSIPPIGVSKSAHSPTTAAIKHHSSSSIVMSTSKSESEVGHVERAYTPLRETPTPKLTTIPQLPREDEKFDLGVKNEEEEVIREDNQEMKQVKTSSNRSSSGSATTTTTSGSKDGSAASAAPIPPPNIPLPKTPKISSPGLKSPMIDMHSSPSSVAPPSNNTDDAVLSSPHIGSVSGGRHSSQPSVESGNALPADLIKELGPRHAVLPSPKVKSTKSSPEKVAQSEYSKKETRSRSKEEPASSDGVGIVEPVGGKSFDEVVQVSDDNREDGQDKEEAKGSLHSGSSSGRSGSSSNNGDGGRNNTESSTTESFYSDREYSENDALFDKPRTEKLLESPAIVYPNRNPTNVTWGQNDEVDRPPIGPVTEKSKETGSPSMKYGNKKKRHQKQKFNVEMPIVGDSPAITASLKERESKGTSAPSTSQTKRGGSRLYSEATISTPPMSQNNSGGAQEPMMSQRRPLPPLPTHSSSAYNTDPNEPLSQQEYQQSSQQSSESFSPGATTNSSSGMTGNSTESHSPRRYHGGVRPPSVMLHGSSPLRSSSGSIVHEKVMQPSASDATNEKTHGYPTSQVNTLLNSGVRVDTSGHQMVTVASTQFEKDQLHPPPPTHHSHSQQEHHGSYQPPVPQGMTTQWDEKHQGQHHQHHPQPYPQGHLNPEQTVVTPQPPRKSWIKRIFGGRDGTHIPKPTGSGAGIATAAAAGTVVGMLANANETRESLIQESEEGSSFADESEESSKVETGASQQHPADANVEQRPPRRSFGQKIKSLFSNWFEPTPEEIRQESVHKYSVSNGPSETASSPSHYNNNNNQGIPDSSHDSSGYHSHGQTQGHEQAIQSPTQSMFNDLHQQANQLAQVHQASQQQQQHQGYTDSNNLGQTTATGTSGTSPLPSPHAMQQQHLAGLQAQQQYQSYQQQPPPQQQHPQQYSQDHSQYTQSIAHQPQPPIQAYESQITQDNYSNHYSQLTQPPPPPPPPQHQAHGSGHNMVNAANVVSKLPALFGIWSALKALRSKKDSDEQQPPPPQQQQQQQQQQPQVQNLNYQQYGDEETESYAPSSDESEGEPRPSFWQKLTGRFKQNAPRPSQPDFDQHHQQEYPYGDPQYQQPQPQYHQSYSQQEPQQMSYQAPQQQQPDMTTTMPMSMPEPEHHQEPPYSQPPEPQYPPPASVSFAGPSNVHPATQPHPQTQGENEGNLISLDSSGSSSYIEGHGASGNDTSVVSSSTAHSHTNGSNLNQIVAGSAAAAAAAGAASAVAGGGTLGRLWDKIMGKKKKSEEAAAHGAGNSEHTPVVEQTTVTDNNMQYASSGQHPIPPSQPQQYQQPYPQQTEQTQNDFMSSILSSQGLGGHQGPPEPTQTTQAGGNGNIFSNIAGILGATSLLQPVMKIFGGSGGNNNGQQPNTSSGSAIPPHQSATGVPNASQAHADDSEDNGISGYLNNLIKIGLPAVSVMHLHGLWKRYRISQKPAQGYFSTVSELVNINGDHYNHNPFKLIKNAEYQPKALPLQYPALDQRLRNIPLAPFTEPRAFERAPEIMNDETVWDIIKDVENDKQKRINELIDPLPTTSTVANDRYEWNTRKKKKPRRVGDNQYGVPSGPDVGIERLGVPEERDIETGSQDGDRDAPANEEPSIPMFAPFSHIPYRIMKAIISRGGEPLFIPAHPSELSSLVKAKNTTKTDESTGPSPYRYRTGTEWSFSASAQLATGCPGSKPIIQDTAVAKGSINRRVGVHWEILRDFFQVVAMYLGLIGFIAISPSNETGQNKWTLVLLTYIPKILSLEVADLTHHNTPFMIVFSMIMLVGVLLWVACTWKNPWDVDEHSLDNSNWAWPSTIDVVQNKFKQFISPWIRNRVVFAILTTLYLPTIKLAMETLVWDYKYWPVKSNPYLHSDNPDFDSMSQSFVPGDPRSLNLRQPDSFCYTTTMKTDVFNGTYVLIPLAVIVVVVVGIWWPMFVSSQIVHHMPYLPNLGGFAKRQTKPKGIVSFTDERYATTNGYYSYKDNLASHQGLSKNDQVVVAKHLQALHYRRLLDLDDSPIKFVYEMFYPGFANTYVRMMYWKFVLVFITVVFRKDNCWARNKSRHSMDTARQVLLMLFSLLFLYRHNRRRPFFDPTANLSELISRAVTMLASIFSIALALVSIDTNKHKGLTITVIILNSLAVLVILYFLLMSTKFMRRWMSGGRNQLVFSPGVLTANSERDPMLHRLAIERVWQDTWSAILLASRDFRLLPNKRLEFSVTQARPPFLIDFHGYPAERHLENLRICENVGIENFRVSTFLERDSNFMRMANIIKNELIGPDVYFRPWDTQDEEITKLSDLGIVPKSIKSWFGQIHVVPFPFIVTIVWDDAPGVAYSFGNIEKLTKLVEQNRNGEVQRRREIRMRLRALEGQVVTLTYEKKSRIKSQLEHHIGSNSSNRPGNTIPYIKGIVRIQRHKSTMWQDRYNFNPGFKCTMDVFETGQLCVVDNKVVSATNPTNMVAGTHIDVRAYNRYLLGSTMSNTSQGLANALSAGSKSAIIGLNNNYDPTPHLTHLFSENQALIEARLPLIQKAFRHYRKWHIEEFDRKQFALSPHFHTLVFSPEHRDNLANLPSYDQLRQIIQNEKNVDIKGLFEYHGQDLASLYQRLNAITPSQSTDPISLPWYIFWDDIYRRYSTLVPQFEQYAADFSPLYTTSICYRPMPRTDLEVFLEERRLWEAIEISSSSSVMRSGSIGGSRGASVAGSRSFGPASLGYSGQPATGFLHSGVLNQLYSWLDNICRNSAASANVSNINSSYRPQ
ncbi:hypothetical protein H4219_002558 [Mycoemilia scoparia]|uniref:Uncharacterized protein n=1 Tax=Mycoemilia scoparia TaxID=417184 RepID=A0A9W8A3R8_9FUNG|nr:hypothetical protein H4219_002558 [Mycoemilia scoparia]